MSRRRKKSRPTPVEVVLDRVLRRIGLRDQLKEWELVEVWPEIVGDELASRSRATAIENGILKVEADNGTWRQELTLLFPRIKELYAQRYGPGRVRDVQWNTGSPGRTGWKR